MKIRESETGVRRWDHVGRPKKKVWKEEIETFRPATKTAGLIRYTSIFSATSPP